MTAYHTATFGGLDYEASGVPNLFRETVGAEMDSAAQFPTFREVLVDLRERFGIEKTPAYYYDEDADEYVEVPNRVVTVNPAWLGDGLDDAPQNSAAWSTPSDQYAAVDAMHMFGPLMPVAREAGYDEAFGHVRGYRNGGQVSLDVFFPGITADDPDTDEARYVIGFEGGYDYFMGRSLRAQVIAFDTETGAILRRLSDRYSTPHRGDAEDRLADYFRAMFDRAEKVGDTLYEVVAEARAYEVDISDTPLNYREFYEALGFPNSEVAKPASELLAPRRHAATAWDLYEAAILTLSRNYDGKVGGSALMGHAGTANTLLYSPASAEQSVYRTLANRLAGQDTLDDDDREAAEAFRRRAKSLDEAVDEALSFRRRVRLILDDDGEGEGEGEDEQAVEQDDEDDEDEPADPPLVADGGEVPNPWERDEWDGLSDDEKREHIHEFVTQADALCAVFARVRDPDEVDGYEDMDACEISFRVSDLTRSETYALRKSLDEGVDSLSRMFGGSSGPRKMGAVDLSELFGSEGGRPEDEDDDEDDEGRAFA